jgi:hypothetical protein
MVWMRMGEDDQVNSFGGNSVLLHLMEDSAEITGMTYKFLKFRVRISNLFGLRVR